MDKVLLKGSLSNPLASAVTGAFALTKRFL